MAVKSIDPGDAPYVLSYLGLRKAVGLIGIALPLVLFRKGNPDPTPRKLMRNRVYAVCGYAILACILGIGAVSLFAPESAVTRLDPVFWFEATAIWAFGWSWFAKGEGILQDGERSLPEGQQGRISLDGGAS